MAPETSISIGLVHGGFILCTPAGIAGQDAKTEVFTSQAKLVKAVRAAIDEYSLVAKNKAEADAE